MIRIWIGAALRRRTCLTRAEVVSVQNTVGISVGGTTTRGNALLLRALVFAIDVAVVVGIRRRRRRLFARALDGRRQPEQDFERLRLAILLNVARQRISQIEAHGQGMSDRQLGAD